MPELENGNVTAWMQAMMSINFTQSTEAPVVESFLWRDWVNEIWGEVDTNGNGELNRKEVIELLEQASSDVAAGLIGEEESLVDFSEDWSWYFESGDDPFPQGDQPWSNDPIPVNQF